MPATQHSATASPGRVLIPELMDDPQLDQELHREALRGLARINAVSGSVRTLWPAILDEVGRQVSTDKPLTVVDVACGGGDIAVGLLQRARRHGLPLRIIGVDVSPVALRIAQQAADRAGCSTTLNADAADDEPSDSDDPADLILLTRDALTQSLPSADIAMSSLFLHHLTEPQTINVLRAMAKAARVILVNDLRRSRAGYAAAVVGTRLLSRSGVVHVDGPRSVRAALTPQELQALAVQAGLVGAQINRRFPWRMLMRWGRP